VEGVVEGRGYAGNAKTWWAGPNAVEIVRVALSSFFASANGACGGVGPQAVRAIAFAKANGAARSCPLIASHLKKISNAPPSVAATAVHQAM